MTPERHGATPGIRKRPILNLTPEVAAYILDPEMANVAADMGAWVEAHECICDDDAGLHREDCPQA